MLYRKISMIEQKNCTHIYTKLNITTYIHIHISVHFYLYCLLLDSNPVFLRHYYVLQPLLYTIPYYDNFKTKIRWKMGGHFLFFFSKRYQSIGFDKLSCRQVSFSSLQGHYHERYINVFQRPNKIYLKGQCYEIFCFWFFSWISFPQALEYTVPLGPFRIFSKILGDIRS